MFAISVCAVKCTQNSDSRKSNLGWDLRLGLSADSSFSVEGTEMVDGQGGYEMEDARSV